MLMKDYEIYGIPANIWADKITPPDYAIIYDTIDEAPLHIDAGPAELENRDYSFWAALEHWTTLEASLLFAGLNPHSYDLYAISCKRMSDTCLTNANEYEWMNGIHFAVADDNLWLFERSSLKPKAPPLEWIKYYQKQVYDKSIQDQFIDCYAEKWINYFGAELNEDNQSQPLTDNSKDQAGRRKQQYDVILAIIDTLGFDSKKIPDNGKAKIKELCLRRKRLFTDEGFLGAWKDGVKAGHFRMLNHEKYSPK